MCCVADLTAVKYEGFGVIYQISRGMSMRWLSWFKGVEDGIIVELRGLDLRCFIRLALVWKRGCGG